VYDIDYHRVLEASDTAPDEFTDWSVTHMGLTRLPYKGEGEKVGVLDTGCDTEHPDLIDVETRDMITGGIPVITQQMNGHGTFVTGQIVASMYNKQGVTGAAPMATALHARVLYGNALDYYRRHMDSDLAMAIRMCVDDGCGVINMSLGGPDRSPVMVSAVSYAVDHGVILVAAAGNERMMGSPYASYPAAYTQVISVASANSHDLPAWFSTQGIAGLAPEEQPEVAIASHNYYWGCLPGAMYGRMTGTSMASPMLAAVALLWRQARQSQNNMPEGEGVTRGFRSWLRRVSDDTNLNGWDAELGFGTLLLSSDECDTFGAAAPE